MDRQDKIDLLKNIEAGKLSINDLKPRELTFLFGYSDINGINKRGLIDGCPVTNKEFERELQKQKHLPRKPIKFDYGPEEPV